jgi:hypothetical protein
MKTWILSGVISNPRNRASKDVKCDEKIFMAVEKVYRIKVKIAEKISHVNDGKAFKAMFGVNK